MTMNSYLPTTTTTKQKKNKKRHLIFFIIVAFYGKKFTLSHKFTYLNYETNYEIHG